MRVRLGAHRATATGLTPAPELTPRLANGARRDLEAAAMISVKKPGG
jgi:hypothetical protein